MIFENFSKKIGKIFKNITSKGKLSESDISSAMHEVKLALLEADVNYKVVKDFIDKLSQKIMGSQILRSLSPFQMVIKIVNEELIELLGGKTCEIEFKPKKINVIMLCGLQGSGKTTQAVKLAVYLRKKKFKPLLVACDIYRPAAVEQLKILAKSVDLDVYFKENSDPVEISQASYLHASENNNNVIILDTAGRIQIDEKLMKELESIKIALNPTEILLVVDSMVGQEIVNIAKEFDKRLNVSGIIVTKFDSDARGGAVLSIKAVTNKSVKFIGTGEKINDFEVFHPERIASRILGMGDILSLIETAEENIDKEDAYALAEKIKKNKFNLDDFLNLLRQIKKLGPLKSLIEKIPNMGFTNLNFDDRIIPKVESMVLSMTLKERLNPEIIDFSRKKRIVAGSGNKLEDLNSFLKKFQESKKMMKQFGDRNGLFSSFFKKH